MEIAIIIVILVTPILVATYFYGGKGTFLAGAIGLAIIAAIVVLLFLAALLGFLDGGFGYELILVLYAGMVIAGGVPISYLLLWIFRKLPRQRY